MLTASGMTGAGHVCCTFADDAHKRAVLGRFLAAGVEAGDRILYFDEHGDDRLVESVLAPRYDLGDLVGSGQLTVANAATGYFDGGVFDGPTRAAAFELVASEAIAAGYRRVRVYADNGWMPAALDDPWAWLDYEVRISWTISQHPLLGLCGFHDGDPQVLPAPALDAAHQHTFNEGERPSAFSLSAEQGAWVLDGEVDAFATDLMTRLLAGAARVDSSAPIDLGGLTFIDGAGAAALATALLATGLHATNPTPVVRRVWRVTGLDLSLIDAAA